MIITYPQYYNDFKCTAQACTDTCCKGWEVVIDKDSYKRYINDEGEFLERIKPYIKHDGDDYVFVSKDGKCPCLRDDMLCDMYIEMGEDALCYTCKRFPRFMDEFGLRREEGLSLSCPEAARLILNCDFKLITVTNNEPLTSLNDIDGELFMFLMLARNIIMEILNNEDKSIRLRLWAVEDFSERIQACIDKEEYIIPKEVNYAKYRKDKEVYDKCMNALEGMIVLNEEWTELLKNADFENFEEYKLKNIALYYVYRYFLKAVDDRDVLGKIKEMLFALVIIQGVGNIEKSAQMYSKEIEHCAENMEILKKKLKEIKEIVGSVK